MITLIGSSEPHGFFQPFRVLYFNIAYFHYAKYCLWVSKPVKIYSADNLSIDRCEIRKAKSIKGFVSPLFYSLQKYLEMSETAPFWLFHLQSVPKITSRNAPRAPECTKNGQILTQEYVPNCLMRTNVDSSTEIKAASLVLKWLTFSIVAKGHKELWNRHP